MAKTTQDQKIYKVGENWKAEIDIDLEVEDVKAPSIKQSRHAVLTIHVKDNFDRDTLGYVVYDRLLCRIVNGVFDDVVAALSVAVSYNDDPGAPQDMAPNGLALNLTYPPTE